MASWNRGLSRAFPLALAVLVAVSIAPQPPSPSPNLAAFPECALGCINDAFDAELCSPSDLECFCSDPAFQRNATICVQTSCTIPDILVSHNVSLTNCGAPIRDKSNELLYVVAPLFSIAFLLFIMRFFHIVTSGLGYALDDWLMLATIIMAIAHFAISVKCKQGRDIWTLTYDEITETFVDFFVGSHLYFITTTIVKLSIIAFYLRIFPNTLTRRILWGTFAFTLLGGLIITIIYIFQCSPVSYFWLRWDGLHEGECMTAAEYLGFAHAAINIAVEIWMIALPLWELRYLKLHRKKKFLVAFMFSLGVIVIVVSGLRLQSLKFKKDPDTPLVVVLNKTWRYLYISIWSNAELMLSIICGNLPSARLFLIKHFPGLGITGSDSTEGSSFRLKPRSQGWGYRDRRAQGNSIQISALETRPATSGDSDNSAPGIKCQTTYTVDNVPDDEQTLVTSNAMAIPESLQQNH